MAQGQISIDYIAGAFVFFAAVIILAGDVLFTVPSLQRSQTVDELELTAWSSSEVLMDGTGYWDNGSANGTDWHNHPQNISYLGLRSNGELSTEKINALIGLPDRRIQQLLELNQSFNIEFTQVVIADTGATFQKGSPPSGVTEPSYPAHTSNTVKYGTEPVRGQSYHFLLADGAGWYNVLYVSEDSDFSSDRQQYNLSINRAVLLTNLPYRIPGGTTQISNGDTLVLERRMGRIGPSPQEHVDTIIRVDRYGAADGYLVEGVFRIW